MIVSSLLVAVFYSLMYDAIQCLPLCDGSGVAHRIHWAAYFTRLLDVILGKVDCWFCIIIIIIIITAAATTTTTTTTGVWGSVVVKALRY